MAPAVPACLFRPFFLAQTIPDGLPRLQRLAGSPLSPALLRPAARILVGQRRPIPWAAVLSLGFDAPKGRVRRPPPGRPTGRTGREGRRLPPILLPSPDLRVDQEAIGPNMQSNGSPLPGGAGAHTAATAARGSRERMRGRS